MSTDTVTDRTLGQPVLDDATVEPDDLTLWSVTTIIGALDKPALLYWAAQQAAEAAIDNTATWQAMLKDRGRGEAVKWLRDARFRRPKTTLSSADLGTLVHALCESYALTGHRPDTDDIAAAVQHAGTKDTDIKHETNIAAAMLNQFDSWLDRFQPSYQATEVCVYEPNYGFAGQSDGFLTIDGVRFIADYKTSREPYDSRGNLKTPYPESVALQLAAYRHAAYAAVWRPRRGTKFRRRYYLLSAAEREMAVPVPDVDTGLVIQISPESCESYPIRCDREVYHAFLYTLEAFRWLTETSTTVMSEPLTAGGE